MKQVPLKSLSAGMVLARDVETAEGYRILGKGTALTDNFIALLEGWGVIDAAVEEPQAEPEARRAESQMENARARLRARFDGRLVNDYMKALLAEADKRIGIARFWKAGILLAFSLGGVLP